MTSTSNLPIDKLETGQGGGKAKGLALLKKFGFRIPETFVVTDLAKDDLKKNISNLPVEKSYAIRSSASVEDGLEHSFAGQFQSFINVKGHKEITTAIQKCFDSASSFNVESYKSGQGSANNIRMNVIIQEMVDVEYSGVLFTVDPVKQRHDMMSLSVASGIGEELMAGHTEGENHSFYKNLHELPDSKLINSGKFRNMAEQALRIELNYDQPADLEWAIDKKGELWWLQLRPITNLSEVHLNELDHQSLNKHPIYTRGNIGEMMPGPVTPLTLSTFARAIEVGLQVFYKKIGALSQHSSDNLFVHSFYNHLFFKHLICYPEQPCSKIPPYRFRILKINRIVTKEQKKF